jgi:hypothetical protein
MIDIIKTVIKISAISLCIGCSTLPPRGGVYLVNQDCPDSRLDHYILQQSGEAFQNSRLAAKLYHVRIEIKKLYNNTVKYDFEVEDLICFYVKVADDGKVAFCQTTKCTVDDTIFCDEALRIVKSYTFPSVKLQAFQFAINLCFKKIK